MVAEDCGGYSIEGHDRRYFGRINGEEATGIWQAWQEGGVYDLG